MELRPWIEHTLKLELDPKFVAYLERQTVESFGPLFDLLNDGARMLLMIWERLYRRGWERHDTLMYTRGEKIFLISVKGDIHISYEGKHYSFTQNRYGQMQLQQWLLEHL